MKRILAAVALLLVGNVTLAAGTDYVVYRARFRAPFSYERSDAGDWENRAGCSDGLVLLECAVERKGTTLNRIAIITFRTQAAGRYYSLETLTSGVYLHEFGTGNGALISLQPFSKGSKQAKAGVDLTVLTFRQRDGAPKSMRGTSLSIAHDQEVERGEMTLRLDTRSSAVAMAAAAANPGDPFSAARATLVDAVEAAGYTPEP
jgi:hypothetical protein